MSNRAKTALRSSTRPSNTADVVAHEAGKPVDEAVAARECGKVTREAAPQKPQQSTRGRPQQPRAPPLVFSIASFCEAHLISPAKFYELCRKGQGPRLMRVDRRVYVTFESASAWRAERERKTAVRRQDAAAEVSTP